MKKVFLLLFFIVWSFLFSKEISLEYLVEKGLSNSLDIKSDKIDIMSDKVTLTNAYLSLLPSASISASKNYYNDQESLISTGFSIGQSVSWKDSRYFSIKNAIISKKNGKLKYEERKRNFIYNIFSKYISILKAENNLKILKSNLKIQKETLKQAKLKYDSGMINKLEYQQTEYRLLTMKIDLKRAQDNLKNLRYELFSYVGIKDDGSKLKELEFETTVADSFDFSFNNEIKIQKNNLKMSKLNLIQQKLNLYPNLSVSFSYNYSSSPPNDFTTLDKYTKSHSIGIGFSYGIFDIPSKQLNYSLAKRRLQLSELQIRKQVRDYKNDVRHLQEDLKNTLETFKMEEQKLKISEENFIMAKEKFNAGFISFYDYDKSKIDYMQAKISYNNLYYDIIMKKANLYLKMSKKLFDKW